MKKIFALLLSIWIPIYLLFGLLASCEKTSTEKVSTVNEAGEKDVVGKWQLVEFYQDLGNGEGSWVPAPNAEQVNFSTDGSFSANEFFPDRQFNKYRIVDSTKIELYSSHSEAKATYIFNRENATTLMFNPVCRENCGRRYRLIG